MNIHSGKSNANSNPNQLDTSKPRKNLIANYLGTAITTGMPLLTLPIFLFLLGENAWGLIAFFWLLIGLISIMEAGINQALIREFGTRINCLPNSIQNIHNLIYTYEKLYWLGSLLCAGILFSSSHLIVERWLDLSDHSQEMGKQAVYAAAIMVVVTISGSLYRSILLASKAHVRLNILSSAFSLVRYGGGATAVYINPTISVYLGWQILVSIAELLWLRHTARNTLPSPPLPAKWNYSEFHKTFRSVSQLFLATLLSALTTQIDKLTISALLPINQLGYYSIASSIVLGLLRFTYPIQSTLLPHLIEAQNSSWQLRNYNCHAYLLIIGLTVTIGISYYLFGNTILALWLADSRASSEVSNLMPLLLCGAALNAFYGIQYVNWLAQGKSKRILHFNSILLLIGLITTPATVIMLGIQGAPIGWLTINLIGATAGLKLLFSSLRQNVEQIN